MGGGGGGGRRRQRRGEDLVHPLEVTLEDLYNGKATKLALRKNVICTVCAGYVPRCIDTHTAHDTRTHTHAHTTDSSGRLYRCAEREERTRTR